MPVLTLIAEQCLAPVPGGTGRYTAQIGAALASCAPAGWSVRSVTAWHRRSAAAALPGVDGPHRLPAGRRALTALWEHGLPPWPGGDSVHATTPLAPARRAAPLIATVHDVVPWTHPQTLTARGVGWHRRMIARLVRYADAIVVPSAAVASELDQLFSIGERLHVIPHGVTALPPPTPERAALRRRQLALPERYLLSVSTLEPRKGLDVLLAALGRPELAGLPLAVVGQPGWGGVDIAEIAGRAGVGSDRVLTLGRLDDADLAIALAGATAVVVPSRAEGFGLPALEGMAAGKPVVHSDIPALTEVVGDAGIAFPVGDAVALAAALRTVVDDQAAASELGRAALARAGSFSWRSAATATWALHTSAPPLTG